MDRFARDLRIALRGLRRAPTFAATAVLILGLGIGMTVAMVAIAQAVLLRPLPVQSPNRVIVLSPVRDRLELSLVPNDLIALRTSSRSMHAIAAFAHWGAFAFPLADGDRSVTLAQARVTGNFFDVLGARPALGRLLQPDDDLPGAVPVMVISDQTWQRQFHRDSTILGRTLRAPYIDHRITIVGVAPPGLDFPVGTDYWTPLATSGSGAIDLVARLAPGAAPTAAGHEVLTQMRSLYPQLHATGTDVQTLTHAIVGNVRPALVILTAAAALLLVIACVNVGNLLLLRASTRVRELAIRRALGATTRDVVRQLLVESVVLGLAGGTLGLVCAAVFRRVLLALAPAHLPRTDVIRLSGAPVGVAVLVTLLAVLLFGVFPALTTARADLGSPLQLGARSGRDTRARRHVRQWLVASQMALALVLLAGAGLLIRSLARLERLDLGYNTQHLSFFELTAPIATYDSMPKYRTLIERVSGRLRGVPGIVAITPVLIPPFLTANVWAFKPTVEGQSQTEADATPLFPVEAGGADYFRTFHIPILRGRGFTDTDRQGAPRVAVVSRAVAQRLWPGRDPLGQHLRFGILDSTHWRTVVGVAGDIRFRSLREATPTIFLPWRQSLTQGFFAIRSSGDLGSVLPAMRRALHEVEPDAGIWNAQTMDDYLIAPLAQPRLNTFLLSSFAFVALLIAAIGLYGIMASAVREQTREISIRMALGATPERLRRDVLGRALAVCVAGGLAGIAGALAASRVISALLFQVSPTDPLTLGVAGACLIAVASVAAYLPARRTTTIEPALALRAE